MNDSDMKAKICEVCMKFNKKRNSQRIKYEN